LLLPKNLSAQSLIVSQEDSSWVYRVKQIQQFLTRFNYQENARGMRLQFVDDIERRKALASLFSHEYVNKSEKAKLIAFVDEVVKKNISISQMDSDWYAVVNCDGKYKNKEVKLDLTLQMQSNQDSSAQWMIVGARAEEFLRLNKTKKKAYLLGNAHELNFMRLFIELKDPHQISNFISPKTKQDHLSILSWMIDKGDLVLNQAKGITFHFFQVPGWVFSVKEFNRKSYNSGWLIFNLEAARTEEKSNILSERLGINL
ncbi:MAG: hypothetical protein ACOC3T_06200, partial [Bacteroidota bacterium]